MAEQAAPPSTVTTREPKAPRQSIKDWSTTKLTRTLRLVNMCNGALLITTGILCMLSILLTPSFSTVSFFH